MRDLSPTLRRLGNDPFTVKRRADGEFIDGRYVRPLGDDTEFIAHGSVQVMTPRELPYCPKQHGSVRLASSIPSAS